jgi:hypothetical protein
LSLEALKEFATPTQLKYINAIRENGSQRAAARHLGVDHAAIVHAMTRLKNAAAIRGALPLTGMQPVPAPFLLKGESLLHNKRTGEDLLVWRKTKLDDAQRWEMIKEAFEGIAAELPRLKPAKAPKTGKEELLNLVTITDLHVGMRAWIAETGANWDLKIAEQVAVGVFFDLLGRAPKARTCVIANLGDFFHYDGVMPVTPTSGHILDADSRYPKMFETGINIMRRIVDKALETHDEVHLLFEEGNHDMISTPVALKFVFKALYEKDNRVKFIDGIAPYHCFEFGKVMLAWHHSHLKPMEQLDRVFAHMFAEVWGRTKFRYGNTGDKHHLKVVDNFGMTMTQHATLAGMDAYAARHGYAAAREATLITYHKERGKVSSITSTPEMVL